MPRGSRVASRTLERAGQDVDLVLKTETGEDDYGPNYSESTTSTVGRVVRGNDAEPIRDASGNAVEVDAEVFVPDDITGLTGGGHEGATEVDVDQDGDSEYLVLEVDEQGNGLVRLFCGRVNA